MKSAITNFAKELSLIEFKEKIKKYVLIGSSTDDNKTLIDALNTNDNILYPLNVITKDATDHPMLPYIISEVKDISTSFIDKDKRLIFTIDLKEDDIPNKNYVYALALCDNEGNVCSISSFAQSFNALKDATQTITITHTLISQENVNEKLSLIKDADAYVTREEFSSFINNHNHDDTMIPRKEFNLAIERLEEKKSDLSVIGDLNKVNTITKNNLVTILNEIINNIGNIKDLDTTNNENIVSAINELKESIGDKDIFDLFEEPTIGLTDAITKLYELIKAIPKPTFKDKVLVEDVNWNEKANSSTIGNIDDYKGSNRENVISILNEIFTLVGDNKTDIYVIETFSSNTKEDLKLNYTIYDGSDDYKGTFKITAYYYDDIVFDIKIYVNTIKKTFEIMDVVANLSHLNENIVSYKNNTEAEYAGKYLLGAAIYYDINDKKLELSIKFNSLKNNTNEIEEILFDRIEVDTGNIDLKADINMSPFPDMNTIKSNKIYPFTKGLKYPNTYENSIRFNLSNRMAYPLFNLGNDPVKIHVSIGGYASCDIIYLHSVNLQYYNNIKKNDITIQNVYLTEAFRYWDTSLPNGVTMDWGLSIRFDSKMNTPLWLVFNTNTNTLKSIKDQEVIVTFDLDYLKKNNTTNIPYTSLTPQSAKGMVNTYVLPFIDTALQREIFYADSVLRPIGSLLHVYRPPEYVKNNLSISYLKLDNTELRQLEDYEDLRYILNSKSFNEVNNNGLATLIASTPERPLQALGFVDSPRTHSDWFTSGSLRMSFKFNVNPTDIVRIDSIYRITNMPNFSFISIWINGSNTVNSSNQQQTRHIWLQLHYKNVDDSDTSQDMFFILSWLNASWNLRKSPYDSTRPIEYKGPTALYSDNVVSVNYNEKWSLGDLVGAFDEGGDYYIDNYDWYLCMIDTIRYREVSYWIKRGNESINSALKDEIYHDVSNKVMLKTIGLQGYPQGYETWIKYRTL